MGLVLSNGLTKDFIRANLKTTKLTGKECMFGMMGKYTKVSFVTT
jgi:hypothetical protein